MKLMSAGWEWNPILVRELTARWRKWPAFAVILLYALVLSIAICRAYMVFVANPWATTINGWAQVRPLGRELFISLSWTLTIGWMLLAPVLTASSISGERERGLMDALHISPLSSARIAGGKLLSALSFIALLLVVPLPIGATCFLLGGVSPAEWAAAFLLQAATAVCGAALGLYCSATKHRTSEALGTALMLSVAMCLVPLCSPLMALNSIFAGTVTGWGVAIGLQLVLTVVLWRMAAKALVKPLPVRERPPLQSAGYASPQVRQPVTGDAAVIPKDWWTEPQAVQRWDMPFAARLQFKNPVLQREVQIRLRVREEKPDASSANMMGCVPLLVGFYLLLGIFLRLVPEAAEMCWWVFAFLWLGGTMLTGAMLGAMSFTREREQNMMEQLLATLLLPSEILWGKVAAPLVVCAYYSIALLPVMLPCIYGWTVATAPDGITATQAVATVWIVFSGALCATVWGAFFSWWCRHSMVATGLTLATLFFAFVALRAVWRHTVSVNEFYRQGRDWFPFGGLINLAGGAEWQGWFNALALGSVLLVLAGSTMFILLRLIHRSQGR